MGFQGGNLELYRRSNISAIDTHSHHLPSSFLSFIS